jgi:hypothetical protein
MRASRRKQGMILDIFNFFCFTTFQVAEEKLEIDAPTTCR